MRVDQSVRRCRRCAGSVEECHHPCHVIAISDHSVRSGTSITESVRWMSLLIRAKTERKQKRSPTQQRECIFKDTIGVQVKYTGSRKVDFLNSSVFHGHITHTKLYEVGRRLLKTEDLRILLGCQNALLVTFLAGVLSFRKEGPTFCAFMEWLLNKLLS